MTLVEDLNLLDRDICSADAQTHDPMEPRNSNGPLRRARSRRSRRANHLHNFSVYPHRVRAMGRLRPLATDSPPASVTTSNGGASRRDYKTLRRNSYTLPLTASSRHVVKWLQATRPPERRSGPSQLS